MELVSGVVHLVPRFGRTTLKLKERKVHEGVFLERVSRLLGRLLFACVRGWLACVCRVCACVRACVRTCVRACVSE